MNCILLYNFCINILRSDKYLLSGSYSQKLLRKVDISSCKMSVTFIHFLMLIGISLILIKTHHYTFFGNLFSMLRVVSCVQTKESSSVAPYECELAYRSSHIFRTGHSRGIHCIVALTSVC